MINATKLKILILTPSIPYPPNWGFGIRVYQFIRYLSQRHHVTVLTYAGVDEADKIAALAETGAIVHTLPPPFTTAAEKRRAQALSLFSTASFQTSSLYTEGMQSTLAKLLMEQTFDIIQIESSQLSKFRFDCTAKLVLDEHNIEYELLQRMYQTESSPLRRIYNGLEYRKFRREEQDSWRSADACVFTSLREKQIVGEYLPDKATVVAPNGVDIDFFRPETIEVVPDTLVFTGLISYRPNTDAVLHFVHEILPLIVKQRPQTKFYIVGMGATHEVQQLAGPHVVVTGQVPDVRPYVHRAAAFVVPLRMGSGTRLKVLEGLAMGKPMVSTSLGCEGIRVNHEEHLLIADEPQAFAESVLRLFQEQEIGNRIGIAGRALVEREYSWPSVVQVLERLHAQLLNANAESTALTR